MKKTRPTYISSAQRTKPTNPNLVPSNLTKQFGAGVITPKGSIPRLGAATLVAR